LDVTLLGLFMAKTGFPDQERQSLTRSLRMGRKPGVRVAKWQYGYKFCSKGILVVFCSKGRLTLFCSKGRLTLFCYKLWTKDKSCVWVADILTRESHQGELVRISRVFVEKPTVEWYCGYWKS
jgi:hypothetical protein